MRFIPTIAALLLASSAFAGAKEPVLCTADGTIRAEPASDARYFITKDGVRTEFKDIGGIGTGITGRMYGDDRKRMIGLYLPDGSKEVPADGMLIVDRGHDFRLKPCK